MPGATFSVGEQKVRPGMYIRTTRAGVPTDGAIPKGIVVALFKASWGPLGQGEAMTDINAVTTLYGIGGTTDAARYAFKGKAAQVIPYRLGTGGAKGSYTVKDSAVADAVKIEARYVGITNLKATIRDSLSDATLRELIIYDDTTEKQTITFTKGATGVGEPQALVDALATVGSDFVTITKIADGSKVLATVTQQALTGGADPTVNGQSYSDALSAVEPGIWNGLVVDTEDTTIHATVQTYIDRVNSQGKRVLTVLGEPTSVDLSTRMTDAKAFNDVAIGYICNGFKLSDGTIVEGYKAAAYCVGRLVSSTITESLTHDVVSGATDIVGALTDPQIRTADLSGAMCFVFNAQKQVQIEYGINTLVTPSADQDDGWKKWRRVKTRWNLMDRVAAAWDPLVGKVDNNSDGWGTLIAAAQGVVNKMIKPEGALKSGTVILDPESPASGDSSWFAFTDLVDNDSNEKMYLTIPFQYGGQ